MEYMGIMAVLVNCALIGLSGQVHRMFPDMTATQTILLIVALEHIMLSIRFIITCAIPDIPGWLATEMAKIEWNRREASRLGNNNTATPSPEELITGTYGGGAVVVGGGGGGSAAVKSIGRFSVSPSHSLTASASALLNNEKTRREAIDREETSSSCNRRDVLTLNTLSTTGSHQNSNQQHHQHHATAVGNNNRQISITPDSIQQIPPFRPRKSKEWTQHPSEVCKS